MALPGGAAEPGLILPVSPGRSAGRPATWPRRCWTARDTGCPQTSGPWAALCKWGPGGWAGGAPGTAEQPDPPRYAALTGSPPFEAAHRQELYRRIRAAQYPLPPHLSPRAQALITRLLAPEPAARPRLQDVLDHGFFTQVRGQRGTRPPGTRQGQGGSLPLAPQGFTPATLPPHACRSAPIFVGQDPLCRLLRGAAAVLGSRRLCRERQDSPPCCPGPAGTRRRPSPPGEGAASLAGPEPCKHPLRKTFISARNRLKSSH